MTEYTKYANSTAKQKDDLVSDKNMIQLNQKLQQLSGISTRSPLKRTRTNGETSPGATEIDENHLNDSENGFTLVGADGKHRPKTQRTNGKFANDGNGGSQSTTRSLTFTNAARAREGEEQRRDVGSMSKNDRRASSSADKTHSIRVTDQSIKYATTMHLKPLIIDCNPKLRFGSSEEKKTSERFVVSFFKTISDAFRHVYPLHCGTLGFDNWWVDRDGRLVAVTNDTDLYIYLAHIDHYPTSINDIQLSPQVPKRLPPSNSLIIKFVHDYISVDDVRDELIKQNVTTIFEIDEMNGTWNGHSRHIRVDIVDKNELSRLLNKGITSLIGNVLNIDEYLPAPKLLICSKCNHPGHTKKECTAHFDVCRRCGFDRNDGNDHGACLFSYHHCGGQHISTDFQCQVINNYRRELVNELKRHPERLPSHIQLFLPGQYRQMGSDKILSKREDGVYRQIYKRNCDKEWPKMPTAAKVSISGHIDVGRVSEWIDSFRNELTAIKEKYAAEQSDIKRRYDEQLKAIQAGWLIIQSQMQTQNETIQAAVTVSNDVLFPTCDALLKAMATVVETAKTTCNDEQKRSYDNVLGAVTEIHQSVKDNRVVLASHTTNLNNLWLKQKSTFCSVIDSIFSASNV